YPEPGDKALSDVNRFQKIYYHRLGTDQTQDVLVYERPDQPDWGMNAEVTDDGRYAVLHVWLGTDRRNRVYYFDLKDPKHPRVTGDVVRLLDDFDASYAFVGNDGPVLYFLTDLNAPRKRVIASGATSVFKAPQIDFDPSGYETKQVFYTSKDGTRVPMFITHRKGLKLDGSNPTYLYGYGGFNFSLTPSFSVATLVWLEMGGV